MCLLVAEHLGISLKQLEFTHQSIEQRGSLAPSRAHSPCTGALLEQEESEEWRGLTPRLERVKGGDCCKPSLDWQETKMLRYRDGKVLLITVTCSIPVGTLHWFTPIFCKKSLGQNNRTLNMCSQGDVPSRLSEVSATCSHKSSATFRRA
jgi:hypothetical protein